MNNRKIASVAFALALAVNTLQAEDESMRKAMTTAGVAKKADRAYGAPRYSDVCFSPRWRRPKDADDPHDTFRDAGSFHSTRLDWVYSNDPKWIAECRKRGYWFTGTLNTILTDAAGKGTREKGRILNKEGKRVAPPWMRGWKEPGYWGCANSPDYRETYLAHAKTLIDGGVDAIQMDDPVINYGAVRWGGCYCEHCQNKAEKQDKTLSREMMKSFQAECVKEFYAFVRKEIDDYAGRRIPWSSNNYDGNMGFPYDLFDYGTAELPHESAMPDKIYSKIAAATQAGRQQIYTVVSTDVPLTRCVIATAYASGGHIIVPYDVYNNNKPRIFGTPEEYADIYGFVRAMSAFLDGYEDSAAIGKGIEESRYGASLPVQVDAEDIYVFVRSQPGKSDSPIAIHLVGWGKSEPFTIRLRSDAFFGTTDVDVCIQIPAKYEKADHDNAEASKDYSSLSERIDLPTHTKGEWIVTEIPALKPWGILIVRTAE